MKILTYNDQAIEQRADGYINATQMCIANSKKFTDWWATDDAKRYIEAISQKTRKPSNSLIDYVSEGFPAKKAYYVHPELSIKIARWISVDFEIWCDTHIKTLIDTSIVNASSMLTVGLSKDKYIKNKFVKGVKDSIESLKINSSRYEEMELIGLGHQSLPLSNALVKLQNGVLITTSVDLAETFNKEHKNVIRDIGSILSQSSNPEVASFLTDNIKESTYIDSFGRTQKCYILTKEGFSFVALGFTGTEANLFKVRYIKAFEEMHDKLRGYAIAHFLGRTKTKQLIYVIRNPITDLVKIGVTNNIQRRITQLECASGCELDLVFCAPNGDNSKEIEHQVHSRFADFRQSGEWFNVSTDLVIEYLTQNAVIELLG